MRTLPTDRAVERRHRTIDQKFERRTRVAQLRNAVEKMAHRLAQSEFDNGMWAGIGDREKSDRHWRAARRQRKALWRLLDALEAAAR
ncbi:hypothetical protein [Micromonospora sp. 4G55]|uniref:hypothetical protein n=1 Tax=Micromonospora sp. 4G55 TaxID=2806102 RepID=UPI001A46B364|nr:hypothetical protein [Micromonospora sp. 4G55]MBM0260729.1 hypothetical protein [Micromonospora sp. 4G55]